MRRGEGEEEIDIKKILKKISLALRRGGAAAGNRPAAASDHLLFFFSGGCCVERGESFSLFFSEIFFRERMA